MEIAYTPTPMKYNLDFVSVSSRVLTTNLLQNKNIKPEFSTACLSTSLCKVRWNELYPHDSSICHTLGLENLMFMMDNMPSEEYRNILTNIKSEIVLIGVFHLLDLIAVMHLLNDNRKVVIGGAIPLLYDPKFLRHILRKMGAENVNDNLIVVKGHVDLTTDLYSIIKEWKDAEITQNDFKTIWDCKDDFIQRLMKLREKIRPMKEGEWWENWGHVSFILNLKCFWGKCKFCAYKRMPLCDFRDDPDRIAQSIRDTMYKYNRKIIRLSDSYFEFSPENLSILEKIKDEFIIEGVFLGVLSLLKRENIEYVNRYLKYFFMGIESFSPYTLKAINKGYRLDHFYKMIENVIKYLDRNIVIHMFLIGDLPMRNIEEIKSSYDEAVRVKKRLVKEGFRVKFTIQPLQLNPLVELEDSLIVGDNSIPTGIQKLVKHFESKGVTFFDNIKDPSVIDEIFIPYHRGIPSDFDIIPSDQLNYLKQWEKI